MSQLVVLVVTPLGIKLAELLSAIDCLSIYAPFTWVECRNKIVENVESLIYNVNNEIQDYPFVITNHKSMQNIEHLVKLSLSSLH